MLEAAESAARAEGFRRLALMATLPGYQLYARHGFTERWRGPIQLPDGVDVDGVEMDKPIA
jgi:hypothetical protein